MPRKETFETGEERERNAISPGLENFLTLIRSRDFLFFFFHRKPPRKLAFKNIFSKNSIKIRINETHCGKFKFPKRRENRIESLLAKLHGRNVRTLTILSFYHSLFELSYISLTLFKPRIEKEKEKKSIT